MGDVFWIHDEFNGRRRPPLAVVKRPRGGKGLQEDIAAMQREGIRVLVSLLSPEEALACGLHEEEQAAREAGIEFLHFPLPDHHIPPDTHAFRAFVIMLARRLWDHQHIGVHCMASIGRATLVTACTLIHLGWDPAQALIDISNARRQPVPDTDEQQEWILHYKPEL